MSEYTDALDALGAPPEPPSEPTEQPVKRGRGRPRKDGSASGSPTPRGRSVKASVSDIKAKLMEAITAINTMVGAVSPPKYQVYLLQPQEIEPLSEALASEISINDKLSKAMTKASAMSPHIALVMCVGSMVIGRYLMYQQMLQAQAAAQATNPVPYATERPAPISQPITENNHRMSADDMEIPVLRR